MIYDSTIWNDDLQHELKSIKDFFENTDLSYDQEFEESNDENYDIITDMQLEEMTELFLSADNNKREEVINKLKI